MFSLVSRKLNVYQVRCLFKAIGVKPVPSIKNRSNVLAKRSFKNYLVKMIQNVTKNVLQLTITAFQGIFGNFHLTTAYFLLKPSIQDHVVFWKKNLSIAQDCSVQCSLKHYKVNWGAKQHISWFIAPCWIFIYFLWPSGSLLLPSTFASIKLSQASWM